jgi:hypothetical protein
LSASIECGIYSDRSWLFSHHPALDSRHLLTDDYIDVPPILGSIAQKHTFLQTFTWYHTTWQPNSHTPFWRPLTIQAFWLEAHVFGEDRFDRWIWLSIAMNCVCLALMYSLAKTISGRRDVALVTVALYGICATVRLLHSSFVFPGAAWVSTGAWKNQEDLFVDAFTLASMIAVARGKWCPALLCAALAVCCKESGWMTFFLDLVVVLLTGQVGKVPRSVWAATILVACVLIGLRASAGHEVFRGFHIGTNRYWYVRYSGAVAGLIGETFCDDPCACVLALMPWAFVFASRRAGNLYAGLAGALAVLGLSALVSTMQLGCSPFIGLTVILCPDTGRLADAVFCGIWIFLVSILLRDRPMRLLALFAVVCSFVAGVPYAGATQVGAHALHLADGFQALFGASLVVAFWAWGEQQVRLSSVQKLLPAGNG